MNGAILRRSAFVHLIDLASASVLVVHAITQARMTVTREVAWVINAFAIPRPRDEAVADLVTELGTDAGTIEACIRQLLDYEILSQASAQEEADAVAHSLLPVHGRDPIAALDRLRRKSLEGAHPYWSVTSPRGLHDAAGQRHRLDVLLLGDCDVQLEADFLRQEAARRGVDLRVAASFTADTGLAAERPHDAVIIGALKARHLVAVGDAAIHDGDPARVYVTEATTLLDRLRAVTTAPIFLDGLPEPTVQPMGFAEAGLHGHRNRYRRVNLGLAELADSRPGVYLVDVAAAFADQGSARLLDDGLVGFTHFGSPGWLLQRPETERLAVHGLFPDMAPLAALVDGDPYRRETLMARTHMDALSTVLGWDRVKCVIVDLDGVLWPGTLAETGRPFAWTPEISGPYSYIGLYFGIHEALKTLRRRGILLACVSKNDEATVRSLWRYGPEAEQRPLLTLNDFVTKRINWRDKAENISDIAAELGFTPDRFVFIDDTAHERERVREALPQVTVLGENLFAVRRALLTDPRLQIPHVTEEAAQRSLLVKAQLDRSRLRAEISDPAAFLRSLHVSHSVACLSAADTAALERVRELFARTTQFNATGRSFSDGELRAIIARPDGRVFVLRTRDRLGDHGLVGAAVIVAGEVLNLVMSCRVIGLGGEAALLAAMAEDAGLGVQALTGRIIATDRNLPVRHLYQLNSYTTCGEGAWTRTLAVALDMAAG